MLQQNHDQIKKTLREILQFKHTYGEMQDLSIRQALGNFYKLG